MSIESISQDWLLDLMRLFDPLRSIDSPDMVEEFLAEFGWDVAGILKIAIDSVVIDDIFPFLDNISNILLEITNGMEFKDVDWQSLLDVISVLSNWDPPDNIFVDDFTPYIQAFTSDLWNYLVFCYFQAYHPQMFALLCYIGAFSLKIQEANGDRGEYVKYLIDWSRLTKVLTNSHDLMQEVYGWETENFQAARLLLNTSAVLANFGFEPEIDIPSNSRLNKYYNEDSPFRNDVLEMRALK